MNLRRRWIAIAFLVVLVACSGRDNNTTTSTTMPTPTSTSTPAPTMVHTPPPPLSPELALQTLCYPPPSILSSDTSNWIRDNCSTIAATYVDGYTDRFGKTIVKVTIDGRMYNVRPTSLVTFTPLAQWERGDQMTLMYDGRFQHQVVSIVMTYHQDKLGDYDFLSRVHDWNPEYLHLRRDRRSK